MSTTKFTWVLQQSLIDSQLIEKNSIFLFSSHWHHFLEERPNFSTRKNVFVVWHFFAKSFRIEFLSLVTLLTETLKDYKVSFELDWAVFRIFKILFQIFGLCTLIRSLHHEVQNVKWKLTEPMPTRKIKKNLTFVKTIHLLDFTCSLFLSKTLSAKKNLQNLKLILKKKSV